MGAFDDPGRNAAATQAGQSDGLRQQYGQLMTGENGSPTLVQDRARGGTAHGLPDGVQLYSIGPDGMHAQSNMNQQVETKAEKLLATAQAESIRNGVNSAAPSFDTAIKQADEDATQEKEKFARMVTTLGPQAQQEIALEQHAQQSLAQSFQNMAQQNVPMDKIMARKEMVDAWLHLDAKDPEYSSFSDALKKAGLLDAATQLKSASESPALEAITKSQQSMVQAQTDQVITRLGYADALSHAGRSDEAWKYQRDAAQLMGVKLPEERPLPPDQKRA